MGRQRRHEEVDKEFKQEGDQIDEVHVIEYVREIASDFNICTSRE